MSIAKPLKRVYGQISNRTPLHLGQWAPIVGTGLAAIGSLYLIFAANMEADQNEGSDQGILEYNEQDPEYCQHAGEEDSSEPSISPRRSSPVIDRRRSAEIARTITRASTTPRITHTTTYQSENSVDPGGRRKVTRWLNLASMQLAAKAHTQFQDSGFHAKERSNFPEVPGETFRNKDLPEFQKAYSNSPIPRSRASSFIGSESSNGEGSSRVPLDVARHLSLPGPSSARLITRPRQARTLPSKGGSCAVAERPGDDTFYNSPSTRHRSLSTGTVASQAHVSRASSVFEVSPTTLTPSGQDAPPKIVVSSD